MAPLSLKIVLDEGAVTRTLMFDTNTNILEAHRIVREKILTLDPNKEYGFFLTSADDDCAGVWLNENRPLGYYKLKDGDSLFCLPKIRNLKVRMLDGTVKTLQVDESQRIEELMVIISEKIGTANYEEYGLCREDMEVDEAAKPSTGTLTLKRKTVQREKDAQLQQMSKKLKTDDNVEWLDHHKTLRELGVDPKDTLLFKRRLFYSDRNIDSRDPVQLNLLYVQTRDAILDGRQVVTEEKAIEFAGIQCQVQFGDFQEKKHRPGFIENLKEFLPEQYACSWGIEKKINKLHEKHLGLSHVEAKHLYTKTARDLPTYGVTFFLVKEQQKGKKKLVPRLLGINSESILRLDEGTKEILQTWLLTQVKSYSAGKESFTLNFGDYSDKSYVVKTNEAIRIKDILEGYIDIIRKKLAAPFNVFGAQGEAICEDMVESSKGTMIQTVVASKVQGHSLVGPNQIICVTQGQQSQHGTQIVTVQQMITTRKGDTSQQPMRGEIGARSSMPMDFGKRLNHLNSECVNTVVLLSNPTMENLQKVRTIVENIEDGLPSIIKGTKEVAAKLHGDESTKLLEELDELVDYIHTLAITTKKSDLSNPDNLTTAQDAARKIAELSTQVCFALDPKLKRRSHLLMRSRNSFIQDEKTEASLRRASFLHAADNAFQAVEQAQAEMDVVCDDPSLNDDELRQLEIKAIDRMGKLNAAIALLLNAHADPRNIDYEMAVNSMKTINEIMPEFIQDAKSLTAAGGKGAGSTLRDQIKQLLNRTGSICKLTGTHDIWNMQNEGNGYADVARKLIFTFNRLECKPVGKATNNEEYQIIALSDDIENQASLLLTVGKELTELEVNDPRSNDVKAASVKCTDAVRGLLACAKLTAQSIHEPHCQSALKAAIENVASSAHNLTLCCKPLMEKPNRHNISKQLFDESTGLTKALDRLNDAFCNLNAMNIEETDIPIDDDSNVQEKNRLKFIMTTRSARNAIADADKELQQMINTPMLPPTKTNDNKSPEIQSRLSQNLAKLNAAIASLLQATDKENPDYKSAETATNVICELTPSIIEDTKSIRGTIDKNSWDYIMEHLTDMLEATQGLCLNAEEDNIQEMNNAASRFANSSGKLVYVFNPRKNPKKEKEIIELSRAALQDASQMLSNVYLLAETIEGEHGDKLDDAGVKIVDSAQRLLRIAEITAPNIADTRCQKPLLTSIECLTDDIRALENILKPLEQSPEYCQTVDKLSHDINLVETGLEKLRKACQDSYGSDNTIDFETSESKPQETKRLKFIATKSAAKKALTKADEQLDSIIRTPTSEKIRGHIDSKNIEGLNKLSDKLAKLNAAIAALIQASSDKDNPDYDNAEIAIDNICKITSDIIKDTEDLHGNIDDRKWKEIAEHLKTIIDATQEICSKSQEGDIKEINDAATKFIISSGKLTYIFNPRQNPKKENQILDLSKSAVEQTSQMLTHVYQLAESIGNEDGNKLDAAGVKVVDMSQELLKTAEIVAPSIADSKCQTALLSSIDSLSDHLQDLKNTWTPLVNAPKHHQVGSQLDFSLKMVQIILDKLKDACQDGAGNNSQGGDINDGKQQERKRLKFIATKSAAKNALTNINAQLDKIMKTPSPKKPEGDVNSENPEVLRRISEKLGTLNAAVATLVQATSGKDNPDYDNAEIALNNMSKVTSDITKDMEYLHENMNEKSWKDIVEHLKVMLDATQKMCTLSEEGDAEEMNDAISKFATSSGKLTYVFNPHKNPKKEEQISVLSKSAVEQTSRMLSNIDQLAKSIGKEDSDKLDDVGVKVVNIAKQLLQTAEVTAPRMADAECRTALLAAINRLSQSLRNLEKTWKPMVQSPEHQHTEDQLNHDLNSIQIALDKLRNACQYDTGADVENNQETQRLLFIATALTAKKAMEEAEKELKDMKTAPLVTIEKAKVPAMKRSLAQRLAQQNSSIASLILATSDETKPDYNSATRSIHSISRLTPDIIKDVKSIRGAINQNSLNTIDDNLSDIVVTTREICKYVEDNNPKELKEAAFKCAKSVGRLSYIFSPSTNTVKENKILDLSKSAAEQTSLMLSDVCELANKIGGGQGKILNHTGVKIVNSSHMLQKTAEILAPTINDEFCQATLVSSIDDLSSLSQELKNNWQPLVQSPQHQQTCQQLEQKLNHVQTTLAKLRNACQDNGDDNKNETKLQETKKLKFISTSSAAKDALSKANIQLDEIIKTPTSKKLKGDISRKSTKVQQHMSEKFAALNAAIATLIQVTSDQNNLDYDNAEIAISNIPKIISGIIKDTQCIHESMDDKSWKDTAGHLKLMLVATQEICAHSQECDVKEMNEAASKFANSSGRLTYIFNPEKNPKKEEQISVLSRSAVEQTSRILCDISKLAESIGNEDGNKLDDFGVKVVDIAHQLLKTAEITAPSIADEQCQTALLSAIDRLSESLRNLENTWKPLVQSPEHRHTEAQLGHDLNSIQIALDKLRDACRCDAEADEDRLMFIATALTAKEAMAKAEKELKDMKTTPSVTIEKTKVPSMKRSLAQRLAQLNSNIASLILATSDDNKPDYRAATQSIHTISRLTPDIIKDVKSIKGAVDQNSWNVIDDNLSDIVVTTREICKYVEDKNPKELKNAAFKCAKSVGRLSYVFSPPTNTVKENMILDLSRSAAEQTSLMLSDVYQLADKIGGEEGKTLNNTRVQVVNASQMLQKTAEILGPTINDAYCQATLISSVDELSNLSKELKDIWQPIVETSQYRQAGEQLEHKLKHLQTTLDKLRHTCQDNSEVSTATRPKINIQPAKNKIKGAEILFQEDKMAEMRANEGLNKEIGTNVLAQRTQISHKIAALNEAVAVLLKTMLDLDTLDVKTVEQSIDIISSITPEIVKETITLQRNVDDKSRQILFEEAKDLCTASHAVCDAVEKCNLEDLNKAATQYAQCSRKLHYIISPRTYPNKEKKVLDMARSTCERTSLMLSRVSRLAQCVEREKGIELDTSGAKVANAAEVYLNNAQITASSINEKNCQSVLVSTAETLTHHTEELKTIWMPLAQRPEHKEIGDQLHRDLRLLLSELGKVQKTCQDDTEEVKMEVQQQKCVIPEPKYSQMENIDNLLENIQKNVKKPQVPERMTIEDNPLRQLASKILDSVTTKIQSKKISPNEQKELTTFSKELEAAIKSLDITNAKCRKDPLDSNRRQDLENAVMNLQQICLLSRRKSGDQNNIVDLADYISDVTASVDDISKTVAGIKTDRGNEAFTDIKNVCEKIQNDASKLLTLEAQVDGNIIDDMLQISQFANDCDNQLKHLTVAVQKIKDENAKKMLKDKLQCLRECCDLLRFATKSSISSATSATIDEGLQNLKDVEKKIEIILKPVESHQTNIDQTVSKPVIEAAQAEFATVAAAGDENALPKALARYAVQMKGGCGADQKYKLKEHLQRLLDLLKLKAVTNSRLLVTWQDVNGPESATTTEKVLEELKSFAEEVDKSHKHSQKGSSSQVQIIKDVDIKSLLIPNAFTITGNEEELNSKLYKQMQKLNSISGTIALSFDKPESLSRTLHTTSEAAKQLAGIARGLKNEDPIQNKRIEEAIQEMNIATYNVLKTSELSCQSSNRIGSRRKLLEACRSLNEAINKLARAASPEKKIKNECDEMNRNLQLQESFLQADAPTCALSYADCLDALNNQNDVIQKLRSEEPILRTDMNTSLRYVTSAVCNSAEFAAQTAYLLSLTDEDQSEAKRGLIDLPRLHKVARSTEDTCLQMICTGSGEQATELKGTLTKQVHLLQEAVDDACEKIKDNNKHPLISNSKELKSALQILHHGIRLRANKEEDFTLEIMKHIDAIKKINGIIKKVPQPKVDKDTKKANMSTEVINNTKSLITNTSMMLKKASLSEEEMISWTKFGSSDVIKAFEALITCIREKGAQAGLIESLKSQEPDAPVKTYLQKEVDIANSWLRRPASQTKDKVAGTKAVEHVVELAEQMCEDLTGGEKDEMNQMIVETKQLLKDCTVKYNSNKASLLMERLKELRTMLEKGVVTRVVEDFLIEIPLDNLETLVHTEKDARKRKFLLEKKIAELLVQLGRVKKTARFVADTGNAPRLELTTTTDQVELLAPALVKAAQQRVERPNDEDSIKHYEELLQQYAQSLANVRELCDQAVDPIDFAQAAGETMHRIKEESTVTNDLQKSAHTSRVILKLGNRVVKAGMKSSQVKKDPELKETLAKIDQIVTAKYADVKRADWRDVMAEIMKKTGEVESALGGENIFLKQAEPDQPIYAAALNLHAAVRDWSARDNEIVAVAKRMAVLMARLSDYMNTENKRELLHTSKSIVYESREVAELAKKLALECSDMRIRNNLLQVCEQIPTISGQLKMLTTIKGASFGQGSKEDKESMNMLVGNAQNLMISIQEVVKAAAGASVKIMSQRGRRMKWVRRNYY